MHDLPNWLFWLMVAGDVVGALAILAAGNALYQINKGGM